MYIYVHLTYHRLNMIQPGNFQCEVIFNFRIWSKRKCTFDMRKTAAKKAYDHSCVDMFTCRLSCQKIKMLKVKSDHYDRLIIKYLRLYRFGNERYQLCANWVIWEFLHKPAFEVNLFKVCKNKNKRLPHVNLVCFHPVVMVCSHQTQSIVPLALDYLTMGWFLPHEIVRKTQLRHILCVCHKCVTHSASFTTPGGNMPLFVHSHGLCM